MFATWLWNKFWVVLVLANLREFFLLDEARVKWRLVFELWVEDAIIF